MLLQLSGIGKRFGLRTVLKQVSADVQPGTVSLLVGANGTGKTTLLRIMAGLTRPSTGSVINQCPEGKLGYLGHATFLYAGLSALENLAFWDRMQGHTPDRGALLAVLDRVSLKPFAEERAGTFSRGMAQRLNLARMLLQQPQLWLLDEPCTGLDSASQDMLRQEIKQARKEGAGIVWISHDLIADAQHADRILAIANRTVVYDGSVEGYFDQTQPTATTTKEVSA